MRGSAIWLYGVTRDVPARRLTGLTGVAGGPVRSVSAAGLVAVIGTVPLPEYDEEPLTRNLTDLTWLDRVARAHHHVVAGVARFGPVVPTRLATIYRDVARVEAVLTERRAELTATLDRVHGRTEWGVKAYAVPDAVAARATDGDPGDRPGLAYLRRRRAQLSGVELARQAALRSAEQVHELLARHAEAVCRHAPHERRGGGQAGVMVLNGAYLARVDAEGGFAEVVRQVAGRHPMLRVELTGPWPPYSFAAIGAGQVSR